MPLFHKKTPEEVMKENDRALRRTDRELERDRTKLEREEKKLEAEIKKAAKSGNKQLCNMYAKQLVALRKQKTRSYQASSQVKSVGTQQKLMHSNMKVAGAMGSTTKAMQEVGKAMDPQKTAAMLQQFQKENMKMGMTEEMINDTLDDMLEESGDEEEQDAIVTQVLDEIGIEVAGKVRDAPAAGAGGLTEEQEVEAQLARLKAM